MSPYVLEVCVDTWEGAQNAIRNGANRLELCAHLIIGGVSASPFLFRKLRRASDIPIHVMVRPRCGDFLYTDAELEQMLDEVAMWRALGADGVVTGALTADGGLDQAKMQKLRAAAGNSMNFVFHRAFDASRDALQTLEAAKQVGVTTILTSGQQPKAVDGLPLIRRLVQRAEGIEIMPGSGVSAQNVALIQSATGASAFHLSARTQRKSPMRYTRAGLSMGLLGACESDRWDCDPQKVGAVHRVLEDIFSG